MLKERASHELIKLGFKEGSDRFDMALMGYMMGWQDRGFHETELLIERNRKVMEEHKEALL